MDAPRTPFADAPSPSPRSAVIIPFPAHAVAWCRGQADTVAVVDAAGHVLRYRTEAALHAAILDQHIAAAEQAQRQTAEEHTAAQHEAFCAGHWLARLPYMLAGASRDRWIGGIIGALVGSVVVLAEILA